MKNFTSLFFCLAFFPVIASAAYLDVKPEHTFYDSVTYWTDLGVTKGHLGEGGQRHFKPFLTLSRAEATRMALNALSIKPSPRPSGFTDIPPKIWYESYASAAWTKGLIQGYPDGTFRGEQKITFAELAKIVATSVGFTPETVTDPWYHPYLEFLEEKNAIPTTVVSLNAPALRGELSEMYYRLVTKRADKPSLTAAQLEARTAVAAAAPTGGPTESTLLTDNFDDGNMDGWSTIDEGSQDAPSEWTVRMLSEIPDDRMKFANPRLVQFENTYNGDPTLVTNRKGTYVVWNNDESHLWKDYTFSVTMNSMDDDGIAALFHYVDSANYIKFGVDRQRKFAKIFKLVNGKEKVLADAPLEYPLGKDFRVSITVKGHIIHVLIDGQDLFGKVTDPSPARGTVGLFTWGNMGSAFEDVIVRKL